MPLGKLPLIDTPFKCVAVDLIGPIEPRSEKSNCYNMSRVVRKPVYCICENKDADQLRGNREADQRLCFRYMDSTVLSLYFQNSKFQASSHLLWLYRLVCVGPGRKPRRPVFSERGSYYLDNDRLCNEIAEVAALASIETERVVG